VFVCTLDYETPITGLHGNGEFIYRSAIGYDDETDYVYSALVIFAPLPGYGDGTGYELVFRIVESSPDGSHIHDYHDGLSTKPFLSQPTDRASVYDLVRHMICTHVDEERPAAVEMMTHTENLPNAALRKFHEIAAEFVNRGYIAGPADPWHGRWVWMMRLP
jgi:hypothetical protein